MFCVAFMGALQRSFSRQIWPPAVLTSGKYVSAHTRTHATGGSKESSLETLMNTSRRQRARARSGGLQPTP
jgi:hypothetical protein